ncbi:RlpA-like double-psi beta-barrel-protein domain-containing protein-containing protein [Chaetomium strumarium]|uniref:RlpA-like double-psi beta-barrel-protein domain-containing protein-containing protein n=1 Tax=Chaetomium strumarium TaxID=1170767 RepID=A0AAJ0GUB1_9PEZI|nr:RlpA-like double-psi beta-barrel-protein domain-containing protein-containing protein [Chaetomium strumarium]
MLSKILISLFTITATFAGMTFASPAPKTDDTHIGTHAPAMAARDIDVAATSGKFTYYNQGLGACGQNYGDGDYVVALSHADFDLSTPNGNPNNNPLCGKRLRASYNGKSVEVTVVDRCVTCNSEDLDLSPAAFGALADLSVGVIQGTWDYI